MRTSNEPLLDRIGDDLYRAWKNIEPISPISMRFPQLTVAEAYSIQQRFVARRLAAAGKVVGKKIGVTSRAVMDMLGVNQPDFGVLLSDMYFSRGAEIERSSLIEPRAEGEIAFLLRRDLQGPGVTPSDVLAASDGVMACFEIVDSRIADWQIQIVDTVADNASCGVFVLSDRIVPVSSVDLGSCRMVIEKNGSIVGVGAGAASLGSPVNAVVWLANTLAGFGEGLKAGEVVLSGALSGLVDADAGDDFRMEVGGIGTCSVRFV
jgi:2-oxopent-4-enoate/cis-2-oxohex-4-enoate hydratase